MGAATSRVSSAAQACLRALDNNGTDPQRTPYESDIQGEQILFFPDQTQPCKDFVHGRCRRSNCKYSHDVSTPFQQLLMHICSAEKTLDIAVFTITNNLIRDVLLEKQRRGVRIRIVTDDSQPSRAFQDSSVDGYSLHRKHMQSESQGSDVQDLAQAGIKVLHDNSEFHMHHKFCIVDGRKLLNGSLNWTVQGVRSNQENVMVTKNLAFVKTFQVIQLAPTERFTLQAAVKSPSVTMMQSAPYDSCQKGSSC